MKDYFINLLKTRTSVLNIIALVLVWGFMIDTTITIVYLILKIDRLTSENISIITDTLSLFKEVIFLVLGALIQRNTSTQDKKASD